MLWQDFLNSAPFMAIMIVESYLSASSPRSRTLPCRSIECLDISSWTNTEPLLCTQPESNGIPGLLLFSVYQEVLTPGQAINTMWWTLAQGVHMCHLRTANPDMVRKSLLQTHFQYCYEESQNWFIFSRRSLYS